MAPRTRSMAQKPANKRTHSQDDIEHRFKKLKEELYEDVADEVQAHMKELMKDQQILWEVATPAQENKRLSDLEYELQQIKEASKERNRDVADGIKQMLDGQRTKFEMINTIQDLVRELETKIQDLDRRLRHLED